MTHKREEILTNLTFGGVLFAFALGAVMVIVAVCSSMTLLFLQAAACIMSLGCAIYALIYSKKPNQFKWAALGLILLTVGLWAGWNFIAQSVLHTK